VKKVDNVMAKKDSCKFLRRQHRNLTLLKASRKDNGYLGLRFTDHQKLNMGFKVETLIFK
jgi:adenine specific DNA methylase Mod